LAARLGPEAMYHLMREVLALAQETVQHYEGILLQVSGEGFVALFGAPVAQEDHARRAVLAAFELSQRLRAPAAVQGQPQGVAVRLGLHTGPVIVGNLAHDPQRPYTASGDTLRLATRLQQKATPGTLLVSAVTYALVHAEVQGEVCPALPLAAASGPVSSTPCVVSSIGVAGSWGVAAGFSAPSWGATRTWRCCRRGWHRLSGARGR
jgi:class 3 adenylate cyclase